MYIDNDTIIVIRLPQLPQDGVISLGELQMMIAGDGPRIVSR